ncbi:putative superkiller viralicidic activity 2-like 2-like [Capsicum annuum]|uniref:Bifunctional inhibitor/plant lipid transfer protein/seed storage helical domain-containing protein n=1 Tax=Capsicum annuum TaxID=4072 RepID=A0A2G2Y1T7_CAPAN|nr:non-specific lipid transfer protein GPI-anchored 30 [Capsicum annuum]KAF3616952.1 putative superkiller viralicidic activity 2-like 2-like [Capsicum annuum]KAF3642498.1 putative superkiller viralicidic activity 2-like 2-like [Capsicum annuum]PHT63679.1 hypothetical protein T459_32501 [Capsicum annuum]
MKSFTMMMMIIVLFLGVMLQVTLGQDNRNRDSSSSCMSRLLPCMNFLNEARGNPPESCCNPLREIIEKMPECLCQMVSIKGSNAAERAGINVNEAQMLPAKCGQPVNYMGCLKGSSSSDSNSAGYSMGTTSMRMLLAVVSLILFQAL